jgi:hypothetical protein
MNRQFGVGVVLLVGGLAGYAAGLAGPYPGRSLSVTAVMVGVTLAAIGRAVDADAEGWA